MSSKPAARPPRRRYLTVSGQLAVMVAAGISIGFLIIIALQFERSRSRLFDFEQHRNTVTTELFASQIYGAVRWRKPEVVRQVYDALVSRSDLSVAAVVVLDNDGALLSRYRQDPAFPFDLAEFLERAVVAGIDGGVHTELLQDHFVVAAPVVSSDGSHRVGTFATAWTRGDLQGLIHATLLRDGTIALIALGAFVAISLVFVGHRIGKPLAEVTEATRRIANGDKSFQVPWTARRDEIGDMARALVTFRENVALIDRLTAEQQQQTMRLAAALEKEREYNALHREFVTMVSHEFRTPMAIIDGAAQRIQRRIGNDTPERLRERIAKIRSAVARMIELIESTLSVSRMEAGTIELETTDCDIASLLTEVCQRQQEISPKHEINLRIANLPASLRADRARLDQVFTNLLSNAVKYAPETPRIDVKAGTIGSNIAVSVRDFGVGIPEDELPRLFQKFYRASTSTGIPGTGIGLHLVKHLVELHGGTVCAESTVGQSTTFSVTLPMAAVRAEAQSAAQSGAAPTTVAATV